jgi:AraC-like DNA-binding protein
MCSHIHEASGSRLDGLCFRRRVCLLIVQSIMDPFVDLIRLLRPQATLWRKIEARGRWGISFRKRDDLLFCWVEQGECFVLRPKMKPLRVGEGDFVLVRTSTPFALATDTKVKCVDSDKAFASPETYGVALGSARGKASTHHGGRFVFDTANEEMLTGMLPQVVHLRAADTSLRRIHQLLKMNAAESAAGRPGSEFVAARLTELILIEVLRNESLQVESDVPSLIGGLSDDVVATALRALHGDVARSWTVGELARLAGVSRSAFALRFREVMGVGPIEYLLNWRMARAKDELRQGARTVSEIAFAVGFQSVSAFSTAFKRRVGCSPGAFAATGR